MRWTPLLLLALAPGLAAAAWPPNGVRITGAPDDQQGPELVSDGAGGAFISWADFRNFSSLNLGADVYLQRVTVAGQIAPGWPVDGVAIAIGPRTQSPRAMAPDGVSGVLIIYADTRLDSGDLYLQRITAAGAVAPGWPATGVPVAVAPGHQHSAELVDDGAGGAFVCWQDGTSTSDSRARYTHVLGTGQLAPGWPAEGRLFEPVHFHVSRPLMLRTGTGGFLACWAVSEDAALSSVGVLAQRFVADGTADPAWPPGGVIICSALPSPRGPVMRLVSDGSGGFYTVFSDYRNSPPGSYAEIDLYAQHVLGTGAIAPGWPADALPVSALAGVEEQYPSLCEDGQGGVFIAWEDYRSGYARIYGQHLLADGQRYAGWPALGMSLTDAANWQLGPQLAWDGWRGAYLAWMNLESTGYRSYAQHLTPGGAPFVGWPTSGLPVVPIPTDQYVPKITADGLGGAIVTWEDIRGGARDVYAQKFVNDGVVATQVSLVSAEATVDEVRIRWHVSGETRAAAERREGETEWLALRDLTADGGGYLSLVDRDVLPGEQYEYRLAFATGGHGGETSVVVPPLALALEGARPNPAEGPLWVAFTLPDASAARLELFDLAGRRLSARDVGVRGAGRHLVRLDDGALSPGLYWAALTQGPRTLRARVAVVR